MLHLLLLILAIFVVCRFIINPLFASVYHDACERRDAREALREEREAEEYRRHIKFMRDNGGWLSPETLAAKRRKQLQDRMNSTWFPIR